MAFNVSLLWISLALLVSGSSAAGEFNVLHSPDSLEFLGSSKTLESLLKEVISACLGLPVDENTEWKGLYVVDPFDTPEAVVQVYVDGVSSLGDFIGLNTITYPLTVDEYEPDIFEAVKHRIKQRCSNGGNKLVNVKLSDLNELPSQNLLNVFGSIKLGKVSKQPLQYLKYSVEEDYQFLHELQAMKAITQKVWFGAVTPDNIVDFYHFRFRSLHALSDFHGPNSLQTKEAKKMLGNSLQELSKSFVKAYDGSALVTAVVTDVAHTRRAIRSPQRGKRQDEEEEGGGEEGGGEDGGGGDDDGGGDGGNGEELNPDYPVMFNIMFWFGVTYFFSLIAIVYAMVDMDPGRDSIIYRMTNTRMKKE